MVRELSRTLPTTAEPVVERDAERVELLGDVEQGGGGGLEAVVAERDQHAGVGGLAQQRLGVLDREALAQLLAREDLRLLGLERLLDHLDRVEDLVRGGRGPLHHPLDGGEVEALVLQLAHQLQPGHVLLAVVADPVAHGGRLEQAPGAVGADVADREAGLRRQLLDRERDARTRPDDSSESTTCRGRSVIAGEHTA